MYRIANFLRDWIPPVVVRFMRQIRKNGNCYEGGFAHWENVASQCTGYDGAHILAKVLDASLMVKRGEAAFERDSVAFKEIEYSWFVLAGLMWSALQNHGNLNVLDFGGSLGSAYFQNKFFLHGLKHFRWNIIEQQHYVEAGQKFIKDEKLKFYKTIEECLSENKPTVVLMSSVLQYIETPFFVIDQLKQLKSCYLVIDRTPFYDCDEDRLVKQVVPASIYNASYPMWIFSEKKFRQLMGVNWHIVATQLCSEGSVQTSDGVRFAFRGMIMEAK